MKRAASELTDGGRGSSDRDREFAGAVLYGAGLAFTAVLAYAFNALMGRRLTPVDFGTFGALLAVLLALAGPSTALFGGAAMSAARTGRVPHTRWMRWVVAVGLLATVFALIPIPGVARAALWFALASAMWLVISWNRGLLIGLGRLALVGGTIVQEGLARLGFALLLVDRGWGVAGASAGLALGMASAALLTSLLLPRQRNQDAQPIAPDVWTAIVGLFFLGVVQFPDIIGVRLAAPHAAGGYTAASSIARIAVYAQAPGVVYALRRTAVKGPSKALRRALLIGIVPGALATAVLEVAPRLILQVTYGGRYLGSVGLVRLLSPAMFLSGLALIFINTSMGAGRTSWVRPISGVSVVGTGIILSVAGIPTSAALAVLGVWTLLVVVAALNTVRLVRLERSAGGGILILNWRDTRHPQGGGSEVFIETVAERLAASGRPVTIFCADHGQSPRKEVRNGVRYVRRGTWWSVYFWAFAYQVTGRLDPHDVVVDVQNAIPFFSPLYCGRPVVALVHHVHREQWRILFRGGVGRLGWWIESRVAPRVYRRTDYVAVSTATKVDLTALGVDPDRVAVVRNGSDGPLAPPAPKAGSPTVTYLGRLVPHKRVELLFQCAAILRHEFPELRVHVVGRGAWEGRLRAAAKALGVQDLVSFEGFVPEEEKRRLLAASWVLALPSVKEGWGLAVMEAAAVGTPAVAYRVGGLQESIVDGVTGLLGVTFEEFVLNIRRLLASSALRDEMGRDAMTRTVEFGWQETAEGLAAVLEQATEPVRQLRPAPSVPAPAMAIPDSSVALLVFDRDRSARDGLSGQATPPPA